MIIRSMLLSTFAGSVAMTAGLLPLLPLPAAASAATGSPTAASAATGSPASTVFRAADASQDSPPTATSLLHEPGTHVRRADGKAAPPPPAGISALSWVVADAGTGDVLAARDAHRELPPASTLKTLFAVTALPRIPAGTRHSVTEAELAGIGAGSSLVGVAPGLTYEVADLWRGVFLSSGNDAVRVLAGLNGGWDETIAQMQAKARALGAHDTRVVSPDGYDSPGQVSSAYDLAVFGRAGLKLPEFVRYCSTAEAAFPGKGGTTFGIKNTNRLLTGAKGVRRYPGAIGIKNGYTSQAGNTLVAAARRGERTIVVTVMNPQSGSSHAVYEEARTLLDWGFDAAPAVRPVGSLEPPRPSARPPLTATAGPEPGPVARAARGHAESGSGEDAYAGTGRAGTGTESAGSTRAAAPDGERAQASRNADTSSGYLWPVVFTGSACLAALALYAVWRAPRRRGESPSPDRDGSRPPL